MKDFALAQANQLIEAKVMSKPAFSRIATVAMLCTAIVSGTAHAADEIKFPALDRSYLKTGDFVGPDHVLRVRPGLGKDQVRLELGNPHFSEGLFAVSEWDYAFNFYTGKGDEFVTCQFKVKFERVDGTYRVASTHWKNPDCAQLVHGPVAAAAIPTSNDGPPRKVAVGTDALFRFDGAGEADLLPEGRKKVEALAHDIRAGAAAVRKIAVIGHTDRLGSDAYNDALSLARAHTVRSVLIAQGLPPEKIHAEGRGKREPVVTDCKGTQASPELLNCLQPNRRVEIDVSTEQ